MGHKVSPIATRIPVTKRWQSQWFAPHKNFSVKIAADLKIRNLIEKSYSEQAAIANVEIAHRQADIEVTIHSARPGVLIGRQGQGIADLRRKFEKELGRPVKVEIKEIRKSELQPKLVAFQIASGLMRNIAYRRVAKQAMEKSMAAGAKGIKIQLAGRLAGAEIARLEKFSNGLIPSTTLQKNIDFAAHTIQTSYGSIGIKVWIYKEVQEQQEL